MALAKIYPSGVNYRTRCTSSEGRICDIFKDLPTWNRFFWQVGLEMKEHFPGQLSLIEIKFRVFTKPEKTLEAAAHLHHLLTLHRCLVSCQLDCFRFDNDHQSLCDALRKSPGLRNLKLGVLLVGMDAQRDIIATLSHLNHLRELEFWKVYLNHSVLQDLSDFLKSTRSLTTLILTQWNLLFEEACVIIQGLKENQTIETLSLRTCRENHDSTQWAVVFADYVSENRTLRTLSVTTDYRESFVEARLIVAAFFRNQTISALSLIGFTLDFGSTKLIGSLLKRNRILRHLHLVKCAWYDSYHRAITYGDYDYTHLMDSFGSGSSLISPWLVGLAENKALEELTLDLSLYQPCECSLFFRTVASNPSLKVTVEKIRHEHAAEIHDVLRESGAQDRCVLKDNVVVDKHCDNLSRVEVNTRFHKFQQLLDTVSLLSTSTGVQSLQLRMRTDQFNGVVASLIAEYIAGTVMLRELDIKFIGPLLIAVDRAERRLVQALSQNKSIRKLSIKGLRFDETDTQILVDMVQSSRTLCELSFYPRNYESTISLVQKLSPNVSDNYMLLGIEVIRYRALGDDLFALKEVVRRNLSLVMRAAHFVTGKRSRYCAAAAEIVHTNPGLVDKVQELASITEKEADARIKASMRSFSELNDFMCVAGVVKDSVTCQRREDGQKQLVDIGLDCWLHVRQYLKVGDILDEE
ncbi:hypothetical protein MTO96_025895 [Rhipicephalus appendiculatus]